jgi:hypothetical protein
MLLIAYQGFRRFLHAFDWWGEPVAPLNMRGQTTHTTSGSGVVGLVITVLLLWFTQIKIMKMINRDDPSLG